MLMKCTYFLCIFMSVTVIGSSFILGPNSLSNEERGLYILSSNILGLLLTIRDIIQTVIVSLKCKLNLRLMSRPPHR